MMCIRNIYTAEGTAAELCLPSLAYLANVCHLELGKLKVG